MLFHHWAIYSMFNYILYGFSLQCPTKVGSKRVYVFFYLDLWGWQQRHRQIIMSLLDWQWKAHRNVNSSCFSSSCAFLLFNFSLFFCDSALSSSAPMTQVMNDKIDRQALIFFVVKYPTLWLVDVTVFVNKTRKLNWCNLNYFVQ